MAKRTSRMTAERESRGWSKAELARRAGMHNSTVGHIEQGRWAPSRRQMQQIADALEWTGDCMALLEPAGTEAGGQDDADHE